MAEMTPMLQQYLRLKEECPQTLLFFRLGDFYEMFNDDALIASRELEIVLTGRGAGRDLRMPMCGVPYHAAMQHIGKLVSRGYKVAVCEQVEDPKTAKGLVAREVVRVYTPGTVVEEGLLPSKTNNYLVAVARDKGRFGLAAADLSTGEFVVTEVSSWESIADELAKLSPAEILTEEEFPLDRELIKARTMDPKHFMAREEALTELTSHYGLISADALGLTDRPAAARAAGAILSYVRLTQRTRVLHLQWPQPYLLDDLMYLDANTRRNFELTRTLRDGKTEGTLFWVLDRTHTPMGARTLHAWIEAPLAKRPAIEQRLDAVAELVADLGRREELTGLLAEAADLPRILARLACAGGNGRDLYALGSTLGLLPRLQSACADFGGSFLTSLLEKLEPLPALAESIISAISPDAPATIKDGGIFRAGYSVELDALRSVARDGRGWVAALEAQERERTGIRSLKVGFNQVFGYYLEVTNANLSLVPADYIRRQTLSNAERYVTAALKEFEEKILGADDRTRALEVELFQALRTEVIQETGRLQNIGTALGVLDVLLSLADVAVRNGYVRPEITEDGCLRLVDARHPVVECCLPGGTFVPNSIVLDSQGTRIQIITGPNMSGKSTYLRQTALVVLLAQIGSFVPARSAVIGVTDRIFTRIGAADDLAGGRSTFLVEMTETAEILRSATRASLLILDEIGRGTGTIDGQAIAQAVLEYIHDRVGAKALFATHYHGLTALVETRSGMANFNVAVVRDGDEITFCHQLRPGAADRSYGIEVARLAGLPPGVLARARELQLTMEEGGQALTLYRREAAPVRQMSLFSARREEILESLHDLDLTGMTPMDALNWLSSSQSILREGAQGRKRSKSRGR